MIPDNIQVFLKDFFKMFNATIDSIKSENGKIVGVISYIEEGEKQRFLWNINGLSLDVQNVWALISFLIKNHLISIDKIIISEEELKLSLAKTGWPLKKIDKAINELLSIKIPMIDNGVISDSFFVHF